MGVIFFLSAVAASAQPIPPLIELSAATAASHPDLARQRAALIRERETLHAGIDSLNSQCNSVVAGSAAEASCRAEQTALSSSLTSHIQRSNDLNSAVRAAAVSPASSPASPAPSTPTADPESAHIIRGMDALASQLHWNAEKRARLDRELNQLDSAESPGTAVQITRIWQDIRARGHDANLMRDASGVAGMKITGAGRQTVDNDCTIFALANAAGLPYGVVAARAAELIRQGEWRNAADRANPQAVIEQRGLNGGEVVMLAEVFGQAEVVPRPAFARTIAQGRPVMINIVPANGDLRLGHEVVLTGTFQHLGETWYVMVDSNRGPRQYLFLNDGELSAILEENGVAWRPNPETVPSLLRNGAPQ